MKCCSVITWEFDFFKVVGGGRDLFFPVLPLTSSSKITHKIMCHFFGVWASGLLLKHPKQNPEVGFCEYCLLVDFL